MAGVVASLALAVALTVMVASFREAVTRWLDQVLPADRWPLFEFGISRLAAERIRIHISLDLLIADAWSSQILLREFAQFAADPALQMAPLELTFRDYQLAAEALTRTAAWALASTSSGPPGSTTTAAMAKPRPASASSTRSCGATVSRP